MKYRLVIFDFDGTLADSFPFFVSVFNQLAERHHFKSIEPHLVPTFRHYNAKQMMEYVGMPAWKLPLVAKSFISLMKQNADRVSLFDKVDEVLLHLVQAGLTVAVVSSNARDNVTRILGPENTRLFSHFECGMSIFGKRAVIRKVLKKTGIPSHEAIYIGDQVTDLEAARKAEVPFGAVSWGYSSIEALCAHHPEEVFDTVSCIKRIS
ncbi:MAG: HAD hydrolase-like protein [Blastocatellia bacterium]|nr:HAD hydrolase-like protein [Blastocatellia bacterium]